MNYPARCTIGPEHYLKGAKRTKSKNATLKFITAIMYWNKPTISDVFY